MNTRSQFRRPLASVVVAVCLLVILTAAGHSSQPAAAHNSTQPDPTQAGEKVFQANCARCHTPPMVLNPRVTRTIVEHMRVRARLTSREEQLLLKYLAP
jgi:mono/diheme cytochrome c family protein